MGRGWGALSMHPEEHPPQKDNERIGYKTPYSAMLPVLSSNSYVCDHAALPRISENAGVSIPLNCLASGKKSLEQLCPSMPLACPGKLQH